VLSARLIVCGQVLRGLAFMPAVLRSTQSFIQGLKP